MTLGPLNKTLQRRSIWHSYDAPYERLNVFSPWTVGGFGLAVCLGLVLVYPYKTLEEQLAGSEAGGKPDRLTVEYLKVFLKAEPTANALRLSLVKQLVALGSLDEAREALAPLHQNADMSLRRNAAWQELAILQTEAFAAAPGTPRREELIAKVHGQLRVLIEMPQDATALLRLARDALATGNSTIAVTAYKQLVQRPEQIAVESFAEAARTTIGLGEYRTGALLYLKAMTQSPALSERREFFIEALRTLQAGGLQDEAIDIAEANIGPLARDTTTLLFLTRLAQSANRPADAERYAKRMLRMSTHSAVGERAVAAVRYQTPIEYVIAQWETDNTAPVMQRAAAELPVGGAAPGLAFDEEAYLLGYNVFLANRNIEDARKLAQAAVRQRPNAAPWRRRLAESSEWSATPVLALENWLAYARLTGDEEGWNATLRLSQSLGNLDILREALQYKVLRDPRNAEWSERLIASYEASGEPERALALLRAQLDDKKHGRRTSGAARRRQLEHFAAIAERAGRDADTLEALRQTQREFGGDSTLALRIAAHLYRQGKIAESFATLHQASASAPTGDADFWRTYAELARLLQDDAASIGYKKLIEADKQSIDDISNLAAVLEPSQPRAAALLAEYGYATSGKAEFFIQALYLHIRVAEWKHAQRLLDAMSPDQRNALERNADFLSARAAVRQTLGDLAGAASDVRAGLALRPDDMERRAALIWTLIAARDGDQLKKLLAAWSADAESNQALWGPFAAANMAINRQDVALHWFRKSGFSSRDYLWLMSYAECLDANSQKELAWQIRRKVWRDLRAPETLKSIDFAQWRELRDRLAGVSPLFAGGDRVQRIIQTLLRSDISALREDLPSATLPADGKTLLKQLAEQENPAAIPANGHRNPQDWFAPGSGTRPGDDLRLTAAARELALAYAINRDAHDLARAWLATRFANQLAKPLWGELTLMLASNDHDQLNRLLDDLPDWLPMYDRIEAAKRVGRPALAQTLAFEQLSLLPHDEDLHLRLVALTTAEVPAFRAEATSLKQSPLEIVRTAIESTVTVANGMKLTLSATRRNQRTTDTSQLRNVPAHDDDVGVTLRKTLDSGFVAATLQRRQAAETTSGLRLDYRLSPKAGTLFSGAASINQRAIESPLLRAGGMRSGLAFNTDYAVSNREYLRGGFGWHRYASQSGTPLGSGLNINAEAGTHLRVEYPNLTLRGFASRTRFTDNGRFDAGLAALIPTGANPSTFRYLPEDTGMFGVAIGVGTIVENDYTRAWRPFAEAGLTYNRVTGSSIDLRGGIAGSVFGQDVLRVRAQRIGGTAANPQGLKEIGIHYTWLY